MSLAVMSGSETVSATFRYEHVTKNVHSSATAVCDDATWTRTTTMHGLQPVLFSLMSVFIHCVWIPTS